MSSTHEAEYSYLVKLLNPEQKSKFMTKIWHNVHDSPENLREKLVKTFENKLPPAFALDIGYFERWGSTKQWIKDQEDLEAM